MPKDRVKEKHQRLVFCSPQKSGEQEHTAKNTAPAVSANNTTTRLLKRITMNKKLFACAAATLHARSDQGSGPFLVPFWARKKGQKENANPCKQPSNKNNHKTLNPKPSTPKKTTIQPKTTN